MTNSCCWKGVSQGGDSCAEHPLLDPSHHSMAQAAAAADTSRQHVAAEAAAGMDEDDVQVCGEVHPPPQQHTLAGSGGAGSAGLPVSASKRRKTGNPKHRPTSADQNQNQQQQHDAGSRGPTATAAAAATAAGSKDPVSRDRAPTIRARASPRADKAAGGGGADTATVGGAGGGGGSNPPMSPVPGHNTGRGRSGQGCPCTYIHTE